MKAENLISRYLVFLSGVYVMTIGIVLAVKCVLGTPPIASLTNVLSINTPYSIGSWMFVFNICLILGQMVLLGKTITRNDLIEIGLQLPAALVFSVFLDFNMYCLRNLAPENYIQSFVMLMCGCVIQSLGLSICIKPNVTLLSADAFVRTATNRYNLKFSRCKIAFDVSVVLSAIIFSVIIAGNIQSVREGTIIAACINGFIVGFFNDKVFSRHSIS